MENTFLTTKQKFALLIAAVATIGIVLLQTGLFENNSEGDTKRMLAEITDDDAKQNATQKAVLENKFVDERQSTANTKRVESPERAASRELNALNKEMEKQLEEIITQNQIPDGNATELDRALAEADQLLAQSAKELGLDANAILTEIDTQMYAIPNDAEGIEVQAKIDEQTERTQTIESKLEFLLTE